MYLWRAKRLSKSAVRNCSWRRRLPLVVGFAYQSCSWLTRPLVSREIVTATERIRSLPDVFFGSFVDFESLSMELRGRAMSEPWPIPFISRSRWRQVCSIRVCRSSSKQSIWVLTTNEQYAASVGCSDRVSVCRGVVRTQLRKGEFYQDFCRPRKPAGNCFRCSKGVHPYLARRRAATLSVVVRSTASTRAVSSKAMCLRPNLLTLSECLQCRTKKLRSVQDCE